MTWCNDAALAVVVGDVGRTEAELLRHRLLDMAGARCRTAVIDASGASWFCDDALQVLHDLAIRFRTGAGLVVVDPPPGLVLHLRRCGIATRVSRITRRDV